MRKQKIIMAVICIALCFLNGCSSQGNESPENSSGKKEVTAYIGQGLCSGNYDPMVDNTFSRGYMLFHSGLAKINAESKVEMDLATSYEISEDCLKYTFHIRKDACFSDGVRMTAADVVFTYEKAKELGAPGIDLSAMEKAEAADEYTVEFMLTEPRSSFLITTALLGIVPEQAYDDNYGDTGMGTGPFKFAQLDVDQQLIVVPNEYYYGEKPKVDQITFLELDNEAALAAAKSGQLDIVMVNPEYAQETIPGMTVEKIETMDVRMFSLPVTESGEMAGVKTGNPVTSDLAVREALNIGIDRQKVIDDALNGIGVPAYGFTNNLPWGNTVPLADGDKEKAAAILEEAGWLDTEGDGIREKDGQRAEINVYSDISELDRYNLASAVAQQAKEFGIQINCHAVPWADIETYYNTDPVVWGFGSFHPDQLYSSYHSDMAVTDTYHNAPMYQSEKTDDYIRQAFQAKSEAKANEFWQKAQDDGSEGPAYEYPYLYLVNIQHCYFIRDGLNIHAETQFPHPHGHGIPIICNMNQWSFE